MNFGAFGIFSGNAFDPRRRLAVEKPLPFLGGQRGLRLGNAGLIAPGTPNSQVKFTADVLVLSNGLGNFVALTAWDMTLSTGAAGLLGLDTGSVASNTWYEVWAIYSSRQRARSAILTAAGSPPLMPYEYDHSLYLGAVRSDGSNNLYRTQQLGARAAYVVVGGTNTAALRQMASGTPGDAAVPTWSSVAIAAFVPPAAVAIDLMLALPRSSSAQSAIAAPSNAYGAITSTSNPPPLGISTNATNTSGHTSAVFMLEGSNVFWAANSATTPSLSARGWIDGGV